MPYINNDFTLTTSATADTVIGTSGNDVITGTSASLNSDTIVDGSTAEADSLTLNGLAFATAINSTGSNIAGIEKINVNFDALTAATFDMAGVSDAPAVAVSNLRAGATSLVTVQNAKSGTVITAGTGLAGGLTVTMAAANQSVTTNSAGVTGTTTVTTTGTGAIIANSGTDALTLSSANGAITVKAAGAATGTLSAIASGSGAVNVTANAATGAVTGQSATGNVTIAANAATGTVTATATAGTAVVNANATAAITATGSSINITSANAGVAATPTVITVNGTAGAADAATVTANGIVTLTNNANLESLSLSGNTAAATYTIAASETIAVTGTQNVTIAGTAAVIAASTVTDNSTATTTATVTDVGGAGDYSLVKTDVISHVAASTAGTYTYANNARVTFVGNPAAGITLDIDDDAAGTTTVGTLNVTLGADTTAILTVDNTADDIDTLNVTVSAAQTALDIRADTTASTGDTINLLGSRAVVVAATATALALNGSAATGAITATAAANILTVSGGSAADSLTLTAAVANSRVSGNAGNDTFTGAGTYLATQTIDGGDGTDTLNAGVATDLSLATFQNVEIIAQGANTLALSSAQAANGLVITGAGAVTINNLAASVDFSGLVFSDATANTVISSANTNAAVGAAAARTYIGTAAIDVITGGDGVDTLSGLAGNDTLIGGAGADALIGGLGNNTYRYLVAATAGSGETITFNTTTGATETIDVDNAAAGAVSVDLSAVNAGALLTGLDAISIGAADTATFAGAQITGLTLAVTGGAGSTLAVTGTTGDDTINLSTATVTTAVVTVAGGTGADTITGSTGADTITGAAGNDVISGGAGADSIDGGADADTVTGGEGADTLTGGLGADSIVLTETTSTIDTVVINASTTGLTTDSASVVVTGAANDLGADTITAFTMATDIIRIVNTSQGAFAHGTNTLIGTATATNAITSGIAGDYAITVGLIDLNANAEFNGVSDIAVNFASPSAALTEANFEAALQYNVTLVAGGVAFTGGDQADTIVGGTGADTIVGGAGADTITAGTGIDTVNGGAGADVISLGVEADTLLIRAGATGAVNSGDSGTHATLAANTRTTTDLDIITGVSVGDKIQFSNATGQYTGAAGAALGLIANGAAVATTLLNTAGLDNGLVIVQGTYTGGTTNTFVGAVGGLDSYLVYDANATLGASVFEAVVLVGYVPATVTGIGGAAGLVTFG